MPLSQQTAYLAVHVGHSRVKIGIFEIENDGCLLDCRKELAFKVSETMPWEVIENHCQEYRQITSVISGSNLVRSREISENWNNQFEKPLLIEQNSTIPVTCLVDVPEKVGPDRLLNVAAVNLLKGVDQPAIVVDSGTAVTIDAVSPQGEFLGGAILPGILMGARAMHEFTTTLPLIDGQRFLETPPNSIGKNTGDAMASGLYWGHLGSIKELIQRVQNQFDGEAQLFLTGGALPILSPYLPNGVCQPYLSLIGSIITAQSILALKAEHEPS